MVMETVLEAQNRLEEKQKGLEELIQERSSVTYYKNKATWMEHFEKCTTFVSNLQHRNATKKNWTETHPMIHQIIF
jgi:hypothetical protein